MEKVPDLMKDAEAAEMSGLSPKTLSNMRSRDEGPPYVRINRTIRYSRRALQEWIKQNTVTPGAA